MARSFAAGIQGIKKDGADWRAYKPNNHFRPRTAKSLATPARICAFETLKLAMDKSLFVSQAFDRVMEGKNLKPEEKAFSRLLSVGTTGTVGV